MLGLPEYPDVVIRAVLLSILSIGWVVAIVRLIGLRSFSKMTAFDFVTTLATGSLLATATTSSSWHAFVQAVVAIGAILTIQMALAFMRRSSANAKATMENAPLLLMRDGRFIDGAMASSRVAEADVFAKLREANVLELASVRAVVLETTGDISVLHGTKVDEKLLMGVRTNGP
ncbi:DUF421 domain-containing protein [Pararhizobium mangrovi]|uniref:DUF421 domain-containing protein n=1 Tax=Pararhizobium mangrovi TaxID=2590452 RepID=UPI001AEE410E|nr:YetF domain-containing protein [Pararhizobium mangrovi]